jgi:hypothetical protein
MMMRMLGSFAEFEREMIRERPASACAKRGPKGAFPAASSKSPPNNARRSSKPCHPAAKQRQKSPAFSKFIAQPSRAWSLKLSIELPMLTYAENHVARDCAHTRRRSALGS